ncbi:MAG TPA: sporulation protein [Mesotoga infera]|uniref:Sporulation protein n=1 Tax=Mesotoga infera TaxID=1236046 RepID=A0A7C1CU56_9BACT|nr:sporulation protein [Mesotoga infera]
MNEGSHDYVLKALIVVVLGLSAIVLTLGGYAIVLREENKRSELIIEEIRNSVLSPIVDQPEMEENPVSLPTGTQVIRETIPIPETQNFFLETFDYRRLIINSFDFLAEGSEFGYVVVEEGTAFKLCVEKGLGKYFITRVGDGFGVMFLGENPLAGLYDSKTAYGIQLVSHTVSDGIAPQVMDLRSAGFPAFVYKSVTADGRTFYAAILGVFPDATAAREYSSTVDVEALQRTTGWNITDRFPRQLK